MIFLKKKVVQSNVPNKTARATEDFNPRPGVDDATIVPLKKGEIVIVKKENDDGWWMIEKNNKNRDNGYVPGSYLEYTNTNYDPNKPLSEREKQLQKTFEN